MNSSARHPTSLFEIFRSCWRNRGLIWKMTRREVVGRYQGSYLGLGWSFFNPLLLLVVYTLIFSEVLKVKWGGGMDESKISFAIILFVGLIIHGLFSECAVRAPSLILSNANYVKRVVFPLEILPWVAMGSAVFHAMISLVVLLIVKLATGNGLSWLALCTPLIILPLIIGTMGFLWALAALGVYVRDIQHFVSLLTSVLLFLSPIFYAVSAVPQSFQKWMILNPLTFIIEQMRATL
ncbi:MAG: ABC transporter permease, partial [Nitrospinaceae bacterium]|nr:ABC transporter permease [Nitrospinaceae bacterium]NIR57817.1 ABC transporter permease [Nitrospinaceae bacterium]NIS88280.1 ABC transporter permease [Nitrospinaceae bacterium]NIT85157.1 ABC transporter permease [Nitrospinaceae bacterium]NIU47313.1 ABC transporter permease [Nitrospinaceae bacterium]